MFGARFLRWMVVACLAVCMVAFGGAGLAGTHPQKARRAILLVSFGTSIPRAQQVFKKIDKAYRSAFPGMEIRWAFTSRIIRNKLAKQGKVWLSPAEALAKLMDQGYTQVVVQSLHVIPGAEFHEVVGVVEGFKAMGAGHRIAIGYPLCSTTDDLKKVAAILLAHPPARLKKDEAIVYMGHGTAHPGGVVYLALQYIMHLKNPRVFLGTVEGYPSLSDVRAQLLAHRIKRVYLVPFMTVAGDHAINDMAGSGQESWKSVLARAGISSVSILRPISEDPAVVQVWIAHTRRAIERLRRGR